jgi:hypothetical protein
MSVHPRHSFVIQLAALASLGASCAGTQNYQNWAESRTRNVTIYTEAKIEHEFMQEWLERSYTAYQAFFPDLKPGKVNVVWLKREPGMLTRVFSPFDDPRAGWTLETVPSGSRIGRDGLIVLQRREEYEAAPDGFRAHSIRDESLAKEQMAHLFIMRGLPMAPLWLQVGLGRYMSKYRVHYKDQFYMACFGSPVFDEPIRMSASEGRALGNGRRVAISIDELLNTDWYRYDGSLRYWYEFTAYAFVHYLIHGEKGYNGTRFPLLLQALRDGKDTDEALAVAYPHILPDEWDDKLLRHMRPSERRTLTGADPNFVHGLCFRIPTEHDADFKPSRSPANPREIQVLLDDLERVEPFRRHGAWLPTDVVEAEAAKHPRKGPAPAPAEPGKRGGDSSGADPNADHGNTPTVHLPVP